MRGRYLWAVAALTAVLLAIVFWLVLGPGWAVSLVQRQAEAELGRKLEVKGGAHLSFSPELAIRLDQVALAAPPGQEGPFITARSVYIPLSIGQFLTRDPSLDTLTLEGAGIALLVDDRGQANWTFPAIKQPRALALKLEDGVLRFFDGRNGQSLALTGARLVINADAGGGVTAAGTAEIAGRLARIDASARSLARIHDDGSPLDLTVTAPDLAVTFNGRVSTREVLNLAGPVAITSPSLRSAARWAGVPAGDGTGYGSLSVTGGLDVAGRAVAVRNADIALDGLAATGDVALDLRAGVPKLQGAVSAATLSLDALLPETGRKPGEWGTSGLGFGLLKSFDAEITVETPSLAYGGMAGMPARLVVKIGNGKLAASAALQAGPAGNLTVETGIDGGSVPPGFSLAVKAENVDVRSILPELAGVSWLSGTGTISAALNGAGNTEEEIIGTLKGTAGAALTDGAILGSDFATMLGAVSQRIVEGWTVRGETRFAALASNFTLADGIAVVEGFRLAGPALEITTTGEVDLLRRALDLRADPRLVLGGNNVKTGLPVAVVVKGPWSAPRIYPDMKGILLDPPAAFEALKTMGLPTAN